MLVTAACVALVLLGVQIVVHQGGARGDASPSWPIYIGASLVAGVTAGVLAAGAGGRLMMRLRAATSPDAHGSLTEAGEKIGEITIGGTLGFILFAGVPAGLVAGALYALVAPLLPRGRVAGIALGVLLLVLAATRIEPLRPDSIDFLLLDPAWLAVLGFSALALFQGMLTAALAPTPPAVASRILTAGRIAVAGVVLVALPGFVDATTDILSG
jgi:uncharacterized membrane protein (UPF0136 family)